MADLTDEQLRDLQLQRLQQTLGRAYDNVPHYRKAFDDAGVRPEDATSLADLGRFPFTTKAHLRENYPFGMLAVPREQLVRVHASSGTTGRPTVVGYTAEDVSTWADVVARSIEVAGGRRGDLVHVVYGYGLFTGGLGAHYGAERLGCTVVPMSGGMTERQVQLIRDFEPRIIMVTPSYFLAIVDEMERQGLDPAASSLEIGIFGAEPWTDEMRREIEQRCNMHAVDIYGLSEVIGPGVAQEAVATKDGLHVWEDHFYPEVIDPVSGDVLPDGEEGELVFTSLTKQAMPIVRYRTRDLTTLEPGTACAPYRRMRKVTGRSDDMMIVRGVNVFPTQVEEQILKVEGLTPHYLCVLTRPGRMDELTVRVEAHDAAIDEQERARITQRLVTLVKDHIGVSVSVEVTEPHALERSLGKAKRIVAEQGDVADQPDVVAHRGGRGVGVLRPDGGRDRAVARQRLPRPVRLRQRLDAALPDRGGDLAHQVGEQPRPGRRGHRGVEQLVAVEPALAAADLLLHRGECVVDPVEVLLRTPLRGQRGQLHLQRLARLDDLRQPAPVRRHGREHRGVGAAVAQDRALAVPNLDQPLHLQHHQGLPHRGPAHAEVGGQLALRGEPVAGLEVELVHECEQPLDELLVETRPLQRSQCSRWSAHPVDLPS